MARPSLPERILTELQAGPSYGTQLARTLGAASGAVTQALKSLQRRGLVEVVGTQPAKGHPRKLYGLVAYPPIPPTRPQRSTSHATEPPPLQHPDGDLLERMDRELHLLRFERDYAGTDIAALIASNRGLA